MKVYINLRTGQNSGSAKIESNLIKERGLKNAREFLETKEGEKQLDRFEFAQDKYSNGEKRIKKINKS